MLARNCGLAVRLGIGTTGVPDFLTATRFLGWAVFLRISSRWSASPFREWSGFEDDFVDLSAAGGEAAHSFSAEGIVALVSGIFCAGSGADGCSGCDASGGIFSAAAAPATV